MGFPVKLLKLGHRRRLYRSKTTIPRWPVFYYTKINEDYRQFEQILNSVDLYTVVTDVSIPTQPLLAFDGNSEKGVPNLVIFLIIGM